MLLRNETLTTDVGVGHKAAFFDVNPSTTSISIETTTLPRLWRHENVHYGWAAVVPAAASKSIVPVYDVRGRQIVKYIGSIRPNSTPEDQHGRAWNLSSFKFNPVPHKKGMKEWSSVPYAKHESNSDIKDHPLKLIENVRICAQWNNKLYIILFEIVFSLLLLIIISRKKPICNSHINNMWKQEYKD